MAISRDLFDESVHHLEADLLVRFLAALEPQLEPHFMIVTKKLDGVVALYRQVVGINGRRKLNLLYPAGGLRGAGILVPLGLFIKELAIIHHRQTGGVAVAAISTRSRPFACANRSASLRDMTPSCCFPSSRTLTSRARIFPLRR